MRTVISVKTASGIEYTEEEFNNITVQIKREVKRVLKEQDLTIGQTLKLLHECIEDIITDVYQEPFGA